MHIRLYELIPDMYDLCGPGASVAVPVVWGSDVAAPGAR